MVAEDGGEALPRVRDGAAEVPAEAVAEEDVVAEHEGAGLAADEVFADEEGLGEAVRRGLLGVGERDAEVGAVAQQALEVGQVRRRRDDEDVADARHHEDRERVVDHGLVVDRQQLLAGHERERVQARARSAREDDAFHAKPFLNLKRCKRHNELLNYTKSIMVRLGCAHKKSPSRFCVGHNKFVLCSNPILDDAFP